MPYFKNKPTLHIFALMAALLIGCSDKDMSSGVGEQRRAPDLVIISTNDIHSNIDRIPKLASLTKIQREENENVILLDAGDRQNGNSTVDYADIPGQPIIELMNRLGYNAATIGNHEFDYGQKNLAKNIKYANFDIVCANISGSDHLAEFEPYTYIYTSKGKKKIVVLGLINVNKSTNQTHALANKLDKISFEDPVVAAKQFKSLSARADMFITLSHCGTYTDSVISSHVPQMDLIIGGGSHEAIFNAKEINGVLNTQTGSGLKYAGITKVWLDGGNVECENKLVDLDNYEDDEEFKIILGDIKSTKDFSQVVGYNETNMNKQEITSLLCRSMMEKCNYHHALYNIDCVNIDLQCKGDMTKEHLYNIESYKYNYYKTKLSIETIKRIITEQYNSRPVKDGICTIYIEGIGQKIEINKEGLITNIILYKDGNILTEASPDLEMVVSEYIYITYNRYMPATSAPIGYITDAVIDHYKNN